MTRNRTAPALGVLLLALVWPAASAAGEPAATSVVPETESSLAPAGTTSTSQPAEAPPPSSPADAPELSSAAPPAAFLIEKIVVDGVRHGSEKIVAAETLLAPGAEYSEAQLQQALQRVERLPFVVRADFALRRGTGRGRFELVVTVTEAAPVFVGGTIDLFRRGGCCFREDWQADGRGPGLGARVFFGGKNELSAGLGGFGHSTLEGTFVTWNMAYTRHDLFGRHAAATIAFAPGTKTRSLTALLAVPLDRSNVVTLSAERLDREYSAWAAEGWWPYEGWTQADWTAYVKELPLSSTEISSQRVGLRWLRDTTDDPFAPRGGSRVEVASAFTVSEYDDPHPWVPPLWAPQGSALTSGPASVHERALSGAVHAARYWPLSRRLSFGIEAGLGASLADADGTLVLDGVSVPVAPDDRGILANARAMLIGTFPESGSGSPPAWWTLSAALSDRERWRDCDASPVCDVLPRIAGSALEDERYGDDYIRQTRDLRTRHLTVGASLAIRGRFGTLSLGVHYRHYFVDRAQ